MVFVAMTLAACGYLPGFASEDGCHGSSAGHAYDFVDARPRFGYASVDEAVRAAPGVPVHDGDELRELDNEVVKEVIVERGGRVVAKVTLDRAQDGGWRAISSEVCGW